jgi:hypothetical protein
MKFKTVKELKQKIEEEVKEDYDFEQHLFKKYPNLFPKGKDGELLPQMQRCCNDCPKGWEQLVDNLFGCIDSYIKNTTKTIINPKKKVKAWIYRNVASDILSQLDRVFNPYNKTINFTGALSPEQKAKRDKLFSMKVRGFTSKVRAWFLSEMYTYTNPEQVKIAQYKEKFGTLRVYADGADDDVDGMIRFAEYLSGKTCQYTGAAACTRNVGGWYITLSEKQYAKVKPRR